MNRNKALLVFLVSWAISGSFAQPGDIKATGIITGQVWDSQLSEPVEYANVVLYRQRDSSQVNGTVTDASGRFLLPGLLPGRYYLQVSFIGYRTNRVRNIELAPDARIDLGRINLEPAVINMPGVEATAEKPRLEYRIDKKVINVAQNPSLQTGTAVDALENAPAVKVDIEGNVSLRGLSSFTVLIDGRPSPLEGNEALKQIPASTIDRIEVVTNPSAKFDPEGKAGIINVILKKQRQSGISGTLNLNGGTSGQFGGNLLLSTKTGIGTFFLSPNINRGGFPGTREMSGWTKTSSGETNYRQSKGTMLFQHQFYGLRAGADFQLTPKDWLSLSARLGGNNGNRSQNARYQEWKTPTTSNETLSYTGTTVSLDRGLNLSFALDAAHNFGKNGHELSLRANLGARNSLDSTQTEESIAGTLRTGKRTIETNQAMPLDLKLDYTLPLREKDKFEAGYQARLRFGPNQKTHAANYDTASGNYIPDAIYSYASSQRDYVHALYSTYSGNWQGLGAMLGLRSEYSLRKVEINDSGYSPLNQLDLFPSLHLSYSFPQEQQIMASYTRRIERPRGWDLSPFLTYMDAKNVRLGNPDLKPEFIDSYEAGFLLPLGKHRLSIDGYYRVTHNVIERFQTIYQEDIMLHTVKNVGKDQALGLEMALDLSPFRWWNLSLNGDIYDYQLKGSLAGKELSQKSFNWDIGLTTDFTLPTSTRIQLRGRYESPTATAQGTEGAHFWTGISARQSLFNRQLILTFSARDIFASSWHEFETQGENFYTFSKFSRRGPMLSLGLTYNFNNYKQERRRPNGEEQEEEQPIDYY